MNKSKELIDLIERSVKVGDNVMIVAHEGPEMGVSPHSNKSGVVTAIDPNGRATVKLDKTGDTVNVHSSVLYPMGVEEAEDSGGYTGKVTYYDSGMMHTIDNFVRFLIGDPKIALKNLRNFGDPQVKGLKFGDEYNQIFNTLFDGFMAVVKKGLG